MNELPRSDAEVTADYRVCFGSPAGQRVLRHLMMITQFFRPLAGNETSSNALWLAEGARQVMIGIVDRVALTDRQLLILYGGNRLHAPGDDE